jgi:N-acetylglucosamine kinase-like BadF-type ATPase
MSKYFLGGDVGGTNTRILIADEDGHAIGYGQSGPGNHEQVGYAGFTRAVQAAAQHALTIANLTIDQIDRAALGIAGFDWPIERAETAGALQSIGLNCPIEIVNDAIIGLVAGSESGWGIAIVSGTGCNCHGLDPSRRREGQVTGGGTMLGEAAGSSELVTKAIQAVAQAWTRRGPATRLTEAFLKYLNVQTIEEMLAGLMDGTLDITASAAPIVFQTANTGDEMALNLIRWAGHELAELAKAVIRQIELAPLAFEVVMVGSMFEGSPLLAETMQHDVLAFAPQARFVRLTTPPVIGAVLLAMERAGLSIDAHVRANLARSINALHQK